MKLPRWLSRPKADAPPEPELRLHVTNVTRGTSLGTQIELADKGENRRKGLLGRTHLPPDAGLWIIPCEAVHTFWMKFPIDVIYIDSKHRVRKVRHSLKAWRISGCLSAKSVIELPAGTARTTQTTRGDQLELIQIEVPRS